ncbi:MAG: hypothetical protein CFE38_08200 [Comamonadaceae bacterium PBBC1]|nr:MAG: hypothetical protein CFE38_08200 [Comamonadaceae bacterium PBBC1]
MLFLALLAFVVRRGQHGGILVLAYFAGLSLIHVPGALIYTGTAPNLADGFVTETGFIATLVGLSAFVVGSLAANLRALKQVVNPVTLTLDYRRVGKVMLLLGVAVYFFAMPVLSFIPSATAIISSAGGLLPMGLWFWLYSAKVTHDRRRFWLGLAMLPLLPLSTMVSGGFIGFGVYWVIAIAAFVYCIVPRKRLFLLLAPVVLGLGLSFAVAYFGERNALRESVWIQQAGLLDRLSRVTQMIERFEFLDLDNFDHVAPINDRLNQNILVGKAIDQREMGLSEPAYGATVPLWIFIPRAIWPDKPAVGGSGDIVSRYTGLDFAVGTSVGVGQPLEFYINFGWPGIAAGFALFGYVLMRLDMALMLAFRRCDVYGVMRAGLPGLALLQPGGSLMEMLVAGIGALIAAPLINRLLKKTGWLEKGRASGRGAVTSTGRSRWNS